MNDRSLHILGYPPKVLIVDDEKNIRESLAKVLQRENFRTYLAANAGEAEVILANESVDLVLTDFMMPNRSGIELLRLIKRQEPDTAVLLITGHATVERAVEAMKEGAADFITKPFKRDDILHRIYRALEQRQRRRHPQRPSRPSSAPDTQQKALIGQNRYIRAISDMIDRVAPTRSTVLISGESGTGKEIIARMIHARSDRSSKPFLGVNCGAIAESVIESELFGHVKGAFTGAIQDKDGLFKSASGGTLFLDEVGALSPNVQVKLLRTLEEREIRPVGATRPVPVDVRVLSACNQPLQAEVEKGLFREDLFYRLNVMSIHIPPLRERPDDIPLLVSHFIARFNREMGKTVRETAPEILTILLKHPWKGNVRELKNALEHAMILCDGDTILPSHLPLRYLSPSVDAAAVIELRESVLQFEKQHIGKTLEITGGDKKEAARLLGLSLSSLYRKMAELGIE